MSSFVIFKYYFYIINNWNWNWTQSMNNQVTRFFIYSSIRYTTPFIYNVSEKYHYASYIEILFYFILKWFQWKRKQTEKVCRLFSLWQNCIIIFSCTFGVFSILEICFFTEDIFFFFYYRWNRNNKLFLAFLDILFSNGINLFQNLLP